MCLVLLLNLAEKKLLPQGDVSILINDEPDKALSVGTGGTLTWSIEWSESILTFCMWRRGNMCNV